MMNFELFVNVMKHCLESIKDIFSLEAKAKEKTRRNKIAKFYAKNTPF